MVNAILTSPPHNIIILTLRCSSPISVGSEIKHWLVNSISAPKKFIEEKTDPEDLECKLVVKSVSERIPILDGENVRRLYDIPAEFTEIIEVEIELLTGRTHQIRGQMKALGMPLVGDRMYYDTANANFQGEGEGERSDEPGICHR